MASIKDGARQQQKQTDQELILERLQKALKQARITGEDAEEYQLQLEGFVFSLGTSFSADQVKPKDISKIIPIITAYITDSFNG